MIFKVIIFFILCISASSVTGQNYLDLVKVSYDQIRPQNFEGQNETADFNELFIDLTTPIPLGKHAIVTGGQYESFNLTVSPAQPDITFRSFLVKAGVRIQHNEKWAGTYLLLPKLSGENLSADAFQLGLISIVTYQKSENLKYKMGVYLNDEFFGPLLVPIFGLYYQKDRFEANLTLPISADLNYMLGANLRAGLNFQGIKKSYLITGTIDGSDAYLEKANNEIGIYFDYKAGPVIFQLMGGHSILRTFRAFQQGDVAGLTLSAVSFRDQRTQLNPNFPNGLFAKMSLRYRLSLER